MDVVAAVSEIRERVCLDRRRGRSVGFVPTMGALHAGHRSLIERARAECQTVVVSIFVNPTQFAPGEDFDRYPRTLDADLSLCRLAGADLVFTPKVADLYPDGARTTVHVADLGDGLCGRHRPGHFDGVATVVAKLFNAVPATRAYFGEKDYQQLCLIERMARDLAFDVAIIACPTVREADGLAMSSRNAYLSPDERRRAVSLSRVLFRARERILEGSRDSAALRDGMKQELIAGGVMEIDYLEFVRPKTLESLLRLEPPLRICGAVRISATRLIDNVAVESSF